MRSVLVQNACYTCLYVGSMYPWKPEHTRACWLMAGACFGFLRRQHKKPKPHATSISATAPPPAPAMIFQGNSLSSESSEVIMFAEFELSAPFSVEMVLSIKIGGPPFGSGTVPVKHHNTSVKRCSIQNTDHTHSNIRRFVHPKPSMELIHTS